MPTMMNLVRRPQTSGTLSKQQIRRGLLVAVMLVLFAAIWLGYNYWNQLNALGNESINIILIGVDAPLLETTSTREGKGTGYPAAFPGYGREADAVVVATIHPQRHTVHLISLPSDMLVRLPDGNEGRLNALFAAGGVPVVERVVEELLRAPLHYHVLIDYEGFTQLVDFVGGVTVNVTTPIRYFVNGEPVFELQPGLHTLNGAQALRYVRYRRSRISDLGRLQRQQKLLGALLEELLQTASLEKLPQFAGLLDELVQTNMHLEEGLKLARFLIRTRDLTVGLSVLPVRKAEVGYRPDEKAVARLAASLFDNPSWQSAEKNQ